MSCCPSTILNFFNVATYSFPYTPAMVAAYGSKPRVDVYVYDLVALEFYTNNGAVPVSQIIFDGANVNIDNGGIASGYVKIS